MWGIPEDEVEAFEPLEGQKPWSVQQVHPSRKLAALEISIPSSEPRAGVWELSSGQLAWAPSEAQVIAWNTTGSEVFVITKAEPYQTGSLERYSWPGQELLGRSFIRLAGYMFRHVRVSPTSGIVAVSDICQDVTTVALYATPERPFGTRRLGELVRPSNLIDELEFGPGGTALVWPISQGVLWWLADGASGGEYLPSTGGSYRAGELCIWETSGGGPTNLRVIDVLADLPPGWLPQEPEKMEFEMIHGPVFLDDRRFRILLPTGEWKTYDLEGKELEDHEAGKVASIKDVAYRSLRAFKDR